MERETIKSYKIKGMHCNHCVHSVKGAIESLEGVSSAEVLLDPPLATINMDLDVQVEQIQKAIQSAGNYSIGKDDPTGFEEDKATETEGKKTGHLATGSYYCPMLCEGDKKYHGPGDCPVCGMDLVPETITLDIESEEEKSYRKLLHKFWISLLFTIPVFFLAMGDMLGLPIEKIGSPTFIGWLQFFLSLPVVFYACWIFFVRGYKSIINKSPNMWTLIMIGAGSAFLFSVIGLLFPDIFPDAFKSGDGSVHLYFEASVVILTLILLGQVLEMRAHRKTNQAVKALVGLIPDKTIRIRDSIETEIDIQEIVVEDVLKIKPGSKIPSDGVVIKGNPIIDESMISGEPIPVEKKQYDHVIAGTINTTRTFLMQAKKIGRDTMLAQIIDLVSKASRTKAPIQNLADRIAIYFVPIVVGIAIISFIFWSWLGPDPKLVYALTAAISVLIIACPCALGLATPMSIMVGTGRAARNGLLIKDASAIEKMQQIDTLLIDKTGTLTVGKPALVRMEVKEPFKKFEVLSAVASLETGSEHPIASAIIQEAREKGIVLSQPEQVESAPGKGLKGRVNGKEVKVGNLRFMSESQILIDPEDQAKMESWQSVGETVMFISIQNKFAGLLSIADPVKENVSTMISQLKDLGLKIIMLTGDQPNTAKAIADRYELDDFDANLLPQDKYDAVARLQESGKKVAMAGDGINDAPALALADIGIAMGNGTDVAIESADMILVKGDLSGIVRAFKLSKEVMQNIKQNLFFAFIYNMIGVPIAAGILFPFFGILLSPMLAAFAMSMSSVSVITNSLRLSQE